MYCPPTENNLNMKKKRKTKPHYVNNAEMLAELRKYNETKVISDELGEMFMKIAKRFGSQPKFSGYSYIEDMISSAVERMVSQIDKYDVTREPGNPFAYFTQTARNQFLAVLKKEKRQRDVKTKYRTKIWDDLCEDEQLEHYEDINNDDID